MSQEDEEPSFLNSSRRIVRSDSVLSIEDQVDGGEETEVIFLNSNNIHFVSLPQNVDSCSINLLLAPPVERDQDQVSQLGLQIALKRALEPVMTELKEVKKQVIKDASVILYQVHKTLCF
jgi:hypothetical protein